MMLSHHLLFYYIVVTVSGAAGAFSPSSRCNSRTTSSCLHIMNMVTEPKGCAAKPLEKKKIAIFGTGGYLGAITYGFLQRAASIYGTGIAGGNSPRVIGATSASSEYLNKELGSKFKLAVATEDLVRLVDMNDDKYIRDRIQGFDAAILGTSYQLEKRAVSANTYEKTPNDKTWEIYLDERYGAWGQDDDVPSADSDIHTSIFRNSVHACKQAGLCHLVVMETPKTICPMDYINILEKEEICYTYIRTNSALSKDKVYTFEKGISNKLDVRIVDGAIDDDKDESDGQEINREDLAALIVQSLMSLDWKNSRILEVRASQMNISSGYGSKEKRKQKYDRFWCPNSDLLAEVLSAL